MKDFPSLYAQLQKSFSTADVEEIELFDDEAFWETLSPEEKEKLSQLFLKKAEDEADEDRLLHWIDLAERLSLNLETLGSAALILFHFAILYEKGRYLLLALDKLILAEEQNPRQFEEQEQWWYLWGNILVSIGHLVHDETFIERALNKYEKAESLLLESLAGDKETSCLDQNELYWDWAQAWMSLGKSSQEISDIQKAIEKFSQVDCDSPYLHIDYAEALILLGKLRGDPHFLEQGILFLRKAIGYPYDPERGPTISYKKAWISYACAAKLRFELTHLDEHFSEADTILREAIVAVPEAAELWLHWGELFLLAGWIHRNLKEVEVALDKLTSSKVKECDPLDLSALLGQGLLILGLFFDDLKLLREGQERVFAALDIAPEHAGLTYAAGIARLTFGLYFSSLADFQKAIEMFEKGLELDISMIKNWHGLFQAYLAWGMAMKETSIVRNGIRAISRLCSLAPFSPLYLNEWGVALLRLRQIEPKKHLLQALVEEAIDKFKKSIALYEEPETLYNLGCAFDLLGDITGNEEDYERAIEILSKVYHLSDATYVQYHLALALSHYGELTMNAESLYRSVELFQSVVQAEPENETYLCDYGYALLNLSELVYDSVRPFEGESLRREAEKGLLHAAELGADEAYYHLACLYSLTGLYDASMNFLTRAEKINSLPAIDDLEHDEWLAGIRETEAFQEFLVARKDDGR